MGKTEKCVPKGLLSHCCKAAALVQGKGQARQGHGVLCPASCCSPDNEWPWVPPSRKGLRALGHSLSFGTSPKCSSKLINASLAH